MRKAIPQMVISPSKGGQMAVKPAIHPTLSLIVPASNEKLIMLVKFDNLETAAEISACEGSIFPGCMDLIACGLKVRYGISY